MPVHEDLPPELRPAPTSRPASGPRREPAATRLFSSRSAHRTVAWVVISAMFLVPLGISLLNILFA